AAGAGGLTPGRLMGGTVRLARKILGRLVPYRWLFASALLQVLGIGLLELAKPWPLKIVVDDVLGGRSLGWAGVGTLGRPALLALIALAVLPLLFGAIVMLSRRITVLATDARIKESAVWAIAQRTIGAIRVIQAFTTEEEEHRRFVATSGASLAANLRLYTSQTVYTAFVNVVVAAGTAAVLWFGVTHVLARQL